MNFNAELLSLLSQHKVHITPINIMKPKDLQEWLFKGNEKDEFYFKCRLRRILGLTLADL